jgi:hypothetical protein
MRHLQRLVLLSLLALMVSAGTGSAQVVRRDDAALVRDYVSARHFLITHNRKEEIT